MDPHEHPFEETLYVKYFRCVDTAIEGNEVLTRDECEECFLDFIVEEISRLDKVQTECESTESKQRNTEILRQSVPESPVLDRLLRYSASVDRSLDRHLTQYERAQRMRMGQPVPPQLKLEVDLSS